MFDQAMTRRSLLGLAGAMGLRPIWPTWLVGSNSMNRHSITGVGQIALAVSDIESAKSFYVGVLGLTHLFDAGPDLAFVDASGVRLMLTRPEGFADAGKNSVVYYRVSDVELAHRTAVEKGAKDGGKPHLIAKLPDHELWIGFLHDPDGNLLGLMEERR